MGQETERVFMQKQPSEGFFKKGVMKYFAESPRKHLRRNLFLIKLNSIVSLKTRLNFAKFARAPFLQNTTGSLILIIAVSIVLEGELANETVNYGTKTKANVPI